jgi:hypothetical protein
MAWLVSQALMRAYENSRCSLEPAGESSEATCSDGARSALSNGNPTPQAFLPPDRMTAFSRPSRFGMTFAPLTDDLGAGLLTWFRGDFLAKTSASQERATDLTGSGLAYGQKWLGSLAKYDHDSRSWRTAQRSLLGDSEGYSETWPRWGTTVAGELYLLPTPELRTEGSESGLWPTPTAHNAKEGGHPSEHGRNTATLTAQAAGGVPTQPMTLNPEWVEWLQGWPRMWTALKPLETDKSHKQQHSHGEH